MWSDGMTEFSKMMQNVFESSCLTFHGKEDSTPIGKIWVTCIHKLCNFLNILENSITPSTHADYINNTIFGLP
jgi:hypothetical protein